MNKVIKNILKALLSVIIAAVVIVLIYLGYLILTYERIEDNTTLEIINPSSNVLEIGKEYKASTYNVGFGCYSEDYSFFMDTSVWDDGTVTTGTYGRGIDKADVMKNVKGSADLLSSFDADFMLIQEVDETATRSFKINMVEYYRSRFPEYSSVFALNYHSSWLNYPLYDPHGVVNAGLLTLSKYKCLSAVRRSYPVSESFSKFFDLDRCFTLERYETENGRDLVIINSHMSAYDEGGVIRTKQLDMLTSVLKEEYEKGNYVIVGGDFNHALGEEYATAFESRMQQPDWVNILNDSDLPFSFRIVKPENGFEVATCRSADIPYTKGINYETIVDGFIVSDNIEAVSVVYNTNYAYSDHQPVVMTFTLK